MRRIAYFYAPAQAPQPPVLPAAAMAPMLIDQCRLGLIWTEMDAKNSVDADAVSDDVFQALDSSLGTGDSKIKLYWPYLQTTRSRFWRGNQVGVMSGIVGESPADHGQPAPDHVDVQPPAGQPDVQPRQQVITFATSDAADRQLTYPPPMTASSSTPAELRRGRGSRGSMTWFRPQDNHRTSKAPSDQRSA
jgi:hypothetical protein